MKVYLIKVYLKKDILWKISHESVSQFENRSVRSIGCFQRLYQKLISEVMSLPTMNILHDEFTDDEFTKD